MSQPTTLTTAAGYPPHTHYHATARPHDGGGAATLKFRSPAGGPNRRTVLAVHVLPVDPAAPRAEVQLFDAAGRRLPGRPIGSGDGALVVFLPDAAPERDYFLRVAADGGECDYAVEIDFRAAVANLRTLAVGTLTPLAPTRHQTLTARRGQSLALQLSAATPEAWVRCGARLTIFDASGGLVTLLIAESGQSNAATTFLAAGEHTVRVEGLWAAGTARPPVSYRLEGVPQGGPDDATADGNPAVTLADRPDEHYAALPLEPVGDVGW
ncbi:MAG TPA: hypothetical protein VGF55_29635 [Gemmataceae bacterium]|jgi:hypothetical protein